MAFGTPVVGAAAYSGISGTSISPAYPAGILATDAVLLFVGQKPTAANGGTATTPDGWTLREEILAAGGYGTTIGADAGNTNLRVYSWDAPVQGQTGTRAVELGGNNISWAFIVRVPTGGGALSYGVADGQRTTAPTSPMSIALTNGASPTAFQAGDIALWAMCIPTDVTTPAQFSAQSITATGATFATAVEMNEPDSSTGNDIGGYSARALVTAGTSSTAPTVTVTLAGTIANVRGPVALVRIRENAVAAITGDLDATETGDDTFSATGTVSDAAITGTLAATETGSDTFTATAKLIVKGSLNTTEVGSDSFSSTGDVIVKGALSVTETGADTFTSTGDVIVKGSLSATETGSDLFAADGEVYTPGVSGDLAATETGTDTFAASGTVFFEDRTGSLAATETGADTFSASGSVFWIDIAGDLSAQESGSDSFAASGTVAYAGITGSLDADEAGTDTASSSGQVVVQGVLTAQETGLDIFTGSGDNVSGGVMNATETGVDVAGLYVEDGYVDPGYVQQAIYGRVLVEGSLIASETGSDRASFIGVQPVQEDTGGGRKDYFRPLREITVRVGVSKKLSTNTRAVKVNVTSQTVAIGWAPGATFKTRPVRIYRSVRPEVKGRVSGGTRSVMVATDFNLKALAVASGLSGYSAPVQVTTTTAQIVAAGMHVSRVGTRTPYVRAVINPKDDEVLMVMAMLKQRRQKQMQQIMRNFK